MAKMSEEKVQAIMDAIKSVSVSYEVDRDQIRDLCPIEFLPGTKMKDEDTELYVFRTTLWMICIVYRLSDGTCEASLQRTPKISIK